MLIFFFFLSFFVFLGPHPQHMEVPRLGIQSELQLPAYSRAAVMPDLSCICNPNQAHNNAGSLTHWARSGINPATSWFLVRLVSAVPRRELPECFSFTLRKKNQWCPFSPLLCNTVLESLPKKILPEKWIKIIQSGKK